MMEISMKMLALSALLVLVADLSQAQTPTPIQPRSRAAAVDNPAPAYKPSMRRGGANNWQRFAGAKTCTLTAVKVMCDNGYDGTFKP
jgi:hypothetical protein